MLFTVRSFVSLCALTSLLGGCSVFDTPSTPPQDNTARLQGMLTWTNQQHTFVPCNEGRTFWLEDHSQQLEQAFWNLAPGSGMQVFADLSGELKGKPKQGSGMRSDGLFEVQQVHRVNAEGLQCVDLNFAASLWRAHGNEPGWSVRIGRQGMQLERADFPPMALPYIVEAVPNGQHSYSSEANGQRIELNLQPGECRDSMTGAFSNWQARLSIGDKVFRGCAYPGALQTAESQPSKPLSAD
ncbi:COG3650 family protein [Atopomonas sediminilitoris]|uniref:COG3650 family protein n=1 Tax=Atopomonas sediminilitoris TaxID=2919919 RepID=UPI001F4DE0BA|nr:hypothetical protein [Atopomonas sediminilitoris]MCJ8168766.1 hypothetical protein [Atopomonas sediminilitoris]